MTELSRRELLRAVLASGVGASVPAAAGLGIALPATAATKAPTRAPARLGATAQRARERLLFDFGWRFHLGHASDPARDFNFGTFQRTYAKAGARTADAAMQEFDDRD